MEDKMDEGDPYWKPLTSSLPQIPRRALATTSPAQADRDRSNFIAMAARAIFGAYRKDDWADPEQALRQMGMVLERYADAIVRTCSNPLTGIQRTCKFPPSIAELVEFCDEIKRRSEFASSYDGRSREQLAERDWLDGEAKSESLEHRKAVAERIKKEWAGR